jgi:hypothetical protein
LQARRPTSGRPEQSLTGGMGDLEFY